MTNLSKCVKFQEKSFTPAFILRDVTYYYERTLQKLWYYIFVKTYSALL